MITSDLFKDVYRGTINKISFQRMQALDTPVKTALLSSRHKMEPRNFYGYVKAPGGRQKVRVKANNHGAAKQLLESQYGKLSGPVWSDSDADRAEKKTNWSSKATSSSSSGDDNGEAFGYVLLFLPFILAGLIIEVVLYQAMPDWLHPLFKIIAVGGINFVAFMVFVALEEAFPRAVRLIVSVFSTILYGLFGYLIAHQMFHLDAVWSSALAIASGFIGYYLVKFLLGELE